jgi:hypothetical protein
MRNLLVIPIMLTLVTGATAQDAKRITEPGVYRFTERIDFKQGGPDLQAELVITIKAFNSARHRIKRDDPQEGTPGRSIHRIDGGMPLGVKDELPLVEITDMTVNFGGVRVAVPKGLYGDCYNPNFGEDSFGTKFSDNGKSLLIFMAGGSEKSLYQVIWIIRKDGIHSRFINNCSDCDYKGLLSFLKKK